jgi:hypothetical protein
MIVHCVRARLRSLSGKKTISSSSFLGWLAGRGAVKTLIDWYVRRRRQEAAQYAAAVQCVCVCHRNSSKRAETALRGLLLPAALLKNQVKAQ